MHDTPSVTTILQTTMVPKRSKERVIEREKKSVCIEAEIGGTGG